MLKNLETEKKNLSLKKVKCLEANIGYFLVLIQVKILEFDEILNAQNSVSEDKC